MWQLLYLQALQTCLRLLGMFFSAHLEVIRLCGHQHPKFVLCSAHIAVLACHGCSKHLVYALDVSCHELFIRGMTMSDQAGDGECPSIRGSSGGVGRQGDSCVWDHCLVYLITLFLKVKPQSRPMAILAQV